MSVRRPWPPFVVAAILGCSGAGREATATAGTSGETSGGSDGESTTEVWGAARVLYWEEAADSPVIVRAVDVLDEGLSAPVDVFTTPYTPFVTPFVASPDRRWVAVGDEVRLIDAETLGVVEISPAWNTTSPVFSPDSSVFRVLGAALDGPFECYVCALSNDGDCTLAKIGPAPQAMEKLWDAELLGEGWILYHLNIEGAGSRILVGNIAAPGVISEVATYPKFAVIEQPRLAADHGALYYAIRESSGQRFFGVDLGVDPPGQSVPVHPLAAESAGALSADGATLLWGAGASGSGDLWRIPLQGGMGGAPVRLNLEPGMVFPRDFGWSPDGVRAAFFAGPSPDMKDLYVVDVFAGSPEPTKINLTPIPVNNPPPAIFYFAPDGQRIAFSASSGTEGLRELYLSTLTGPPETVKLSQGEMMWGQLRWAANGERVLYVRAAPPSGTAELYAVDVRGATPAAPIKISAPMLKGGQVRDYDLTADGGRAFFITGRPPDPFPLYTVEFDLDGQATSPVKIAADTETMIVLPPPG